MLALATPPAFAAPSGDVTAIVRVDCRVLAVDPAPHRLVGYVFTPTGVVSVTHDYGARTSGAFETTRELAPLRTDVFEALVRSIATPRFYVPHVYRKVGDDPRLTDRRVAVRRAGTTAQIAVEEPVGAGDQTFSHEVEVALGRAVAELRGASWTPVSGGFDPFALCRTPRAALGRIADSTTPPVTEIVVADCHLGNELYPRSGLRGFVLTADGRATRMTGVADLRADRSAVTYERSEIGIGEYREIAHLIEASPFFSQSHAHLGVVTSDLRGTRVRAARGSSRITWQSDAISVDRRSIVEAVIVAVFTAVEQRRLTWTAVDAATDPFAICREPVQTGLDLTASF